MISNLNLKADLRQTLGSPTSRRIRASGGIPAVIYNKNDKDNLYVIVAAKELEQEYFKGNIFTSIFTIELNGKNIQVIPHKIDLNPLTDRPEHVDFIKVEKDKPVKAQVKINFINKEKSPGLKKGGFLHVVMRKITLICQPSAIPEVIEIDVGNMQVGQKIRNSLISLPAGVQFAKKGDFLIASIIGRSSKTTQEEGTAATTATASATTASAPAATDKKDSEKK